jgi:hypothetical protein
MSFGFTMAAVSDFDGDGYGDVVIGAPIRSDGSGAAYLFTGDASGLDPVAASETAMPDRAFFGEAIAGCRDVNAAGASDVVIGAPSWNDGGGPGQWSRIRDLRRRRDRSGTRSGARR